MSGGFPSGWAELPLADLLREPLRNGHSASASANGTGIRTLTLTAVTVGDFSEANTKLTIADPAKVADLWLEPGDILVERSNTPELVGTARLYRGPRAFAIFPDLMIRVRLCEGISPGVVEAFLQSTQIRTYFQRAAQGNAGTMPKISQGTIEAVVVRVPPRAEQHRLLQAVESYFTRLDDATATLERVERNLKRYRASVLKAAVEGRLVPTEAALAKKARRAYEPASVLLERILAERRRRWVDSGKKGEYQEPTRADLANTPKLPEGWCWATIDQVVDIIDYRGRTPPYSEDGIPHLRSSNIRHGKVIWSDLRFVSEETYERFMTRGLPQEGDLLFTTEAPLGEIAFAPASRFSLAQRTMILQPNRSALVPAFLYCQIQAPSFQRSIRFKKSGSGVTGISSRNLKPVLVALPPLAEQLRIAGQVDVLLSRIDHATSIPRQSVQRCARLRQAILKWAFEGKLADQDASDEPASALLERIKAERAAATDAETTQPKKKQVRA